MYLDLALRIFEIDTLFNFLFSPFIAVRGVLPVGFITDLVFMICVTILPP